MPPIGPREKHILEQIQALILEVSVYKKQLQERLIEQGFDRVEAWGQAQTFEELTLGKVLNEGSRILPIAELMDRFLEDLLDIE